MPVEHYMKKYHVSHAKAAQIQRAIWANRTRQAKAGNPKYRKYLHARGIGSKEMRSMGNLMIHRRGYHRKDGTYVRPTNYLAKDGGYPGRTPASDRWFPQDDEAHRLVYNGDEWHADDPMEERHRILRGLAERKGWVPLIRRLNALRNVSTSRKLDHAATADIKWMQNQR